MQQQNYVELTAAGVVFSDPLVVGFGRRWGGDETVMRAMQATLQARRTWRSATRTACSLRAIVRGGEGHVGAFQNPDVFLCEAVLLGCNAPKRP